MLMSTVSGPGYTSAAPLYGPPNSSAMPLYGRFGCVGCGLGGVAEVEQLQVALVGLAQATGITDLYNPMVASGQMNDETAMAALTVLWQVAGDVPLVGTLKKQLVDRIPGVSSILGTVLNNYALRAAGWASLGAKKGDVRQWVADNAGTIVYAVRWLTAKKAGLPLPQLPGGAGNPALLYQPMNITGRFTPTGGGAGAIQTYSAKRGRWLIARPLSGGLGDWLADATHILANESAAAVPDARTVTNEEFDKATGGKPGASPWYKTTMGKVGIGAGVAAVLGAGYWFFIR